MFTSKQNEIIGRAHEQLNIRPVIANTADIRGLDFESLSIEEYADLMEEEADFSVLASQMSHSANEREETQKYSQQLKTYVQELRNSI
jgi:hypothetical protein